MKTRTYSSGEVRQAWQALGLIVMVTLFAALFAGCTQLAPAKTVPERIAYAYGVQTAVLNATAQSVEFGDLTPDQGRRVLAVADEATQALELSRTLYNAGREMEAGRELQLAIVLLNELQTYLRTER